MCCNFVVEPKVGIDDLIAMAILAGARDIAQIARFATRLHPNSHRIAGFFTTFYP
jgi:hypothetical protein